MHEAEERLAEHRKALEEERSNHRAKLEAAETAQRRAEERSKDLEETVRALRAEAAAKVPKRSFR